MIIGSLNSVVHFHLPDGALSELSVDGTCPGSTPDEDLCLLVNSV